ncbi:MAG: helix-turn-helix domain-containing protein [Anaerolineaceae bacterium]|nr:helix-turn-helix domain-containing protein [Anaerolineaceae bacterium]
MSMISEERASDSPFVESVMRAWTIAEGSTVRPAESHWHMVLVRVNGQVLPLVVGSLPTSGVAHWGEGAEILWIKFKLGTFIPQLPAKNLIAKETLLPDASSKSFWLHGTSWELPNFENADTFVDRLVKNEVLIQDPVVSSALKGHPTDAAPRTVRHRFLQATGMTQNHIHQIERAQQAAALLRHGKSILDTVYELGYYDQPHLTKSLKQWVGETPAQIIKSNTSE